MNFLSEYISQFFDMLFSLVLASVKFVQRSTKFGLISKLSHGYPNDRNVIVRFLFFFHIKSQILVPLLGHLCGIWLHLL